MLCLPALHACVLSCVRACCIVVCVLSCLPACVRLPNQTINQSISPRHTHTYTPNGRRPRRRRAAQTGDYAWKHHRRLRIKLINAEGHETVVPQLVLNEVGGVEEDGPGSGGEGIITEGGEDRQRRGSLLLSLQKKGKSSSLDSPLHTLIHQVFSQLTPNPPHPPPPRFSSPRRTPPAPPSSTSAWTRSSARRCGAPASSSPRAPAPRPGSSRRPRYNKTSMD